MWLAFFFADTEIGVLSELVNIALPERFQELNFFCVCIRMKIGLVDQILSIVLAEGHPPGNAVDIVEKINRCFFVIVISPPLSWISFVLF